jgi:NAD(P)H-dependent FMN reductase
MPAKMQKTSSAETMNRSDALVIVAPEHNHGYPGMLKHVLDTNLHGYVHKAGGVVGVSAGVFGGARVIQNLIPVMRELGLVQIFWISTSPPSAAASMQTAN